MKLENVYSYLLAIRDTKDLIKLILRRENQNEYEYEMNEILFGKNMFAH